MRRFLPLLAFLGLSSALALPPANGQKPLTVFLGTIDYTSLATFPQPEEDISADMFDRFKPVRAADFCGVSFRTDPTAGTMVVSAPSLSRLTQVFVHLLRRTTSIVVANGIAGRNDRASWSEVVYDIRTRTLTFMLGGGVTGLFTMGVSLDGRAVQPLHYNAVSTPVRVPTGTRIIDVYVRLTGDTLASWQRLTIDLSRPSIKTFKEVAFPAP